MLSVPLPIVVALMLVMVIIFNRDALVSLPSGRWFLALLGVYCVVLVLIGIRWTGGIMNVMPYLPILAVFWCILTWIAFRSLSRTGAATDRADWPHLLPLVAVVAALFATPFVLETVIVASNLVYAWLLAGLARRGADALRMVKFGAARYCIKALWISAGMLVYFALIEIVITIDFEVWRGQHAAMIVTLANVPSLFLLGLVAAGAGQTGSSHEELGNVGPKVLMPTRADNDQTDDLSACRSDDRTNERSDNSTDDRSGNGDEPDYGALLDRLTELLVGQALYKDTELNLQRLARKAGVPARQVSRAVNTQTGLNVSQWVNEARIKAACDLLRGSDATVQEIMYQVGFATKSNFNREFRRITGVSPSAWRRSQSVKGQA